MGYPHPLSQPDCLALSGNSNLSVFFADMSCHIATQYASPINENLKIYCKNSACCKSCHFIMAYRVYVYIYRFKVTFFCSYLSNENKSSNSALLSIKSSAENVISLCPIFINSSVKILCAVK